MSLSAKIRQIHPSARSFNDYLVEASGRPQSRVERIVFWNQDTLGPQPEYSYWDLVDAPDLVLEDLRSGKIAALHSWWDNHPGIEVRAGVILPIQEDGRSTNASSLSLALLTSSAVVALVSVDDYTVELPTTEAIAALAVFLSVYDAISSTWDTVHQQLLAAESVEAIEAISIPT